MDMERYLKTFAALSLIWAIILSSASADDRKNTSELIRSRGFNVDLYELISQGYILRLNRIRNPYADLRSVHPVPVIIYHGIGFDSTNMMASSKNARPRRPRLDQRVTLYSMENGTDDRGLHFYLSNNNYDVWTMDARATNNGAKTRIHEKGAKALFDFGLDEQALIDLPMQIEFVLNKTGAPKVSYIAYSQSTTLMFMLLSMRPQYADKLANFIAMGPVVFTGHLKGLAKPFFEGRLYLNSYSVASSILPSWLRKLQNFMMTYTCSISFIKNTLCRAVWQGISGPDKHAVLEGGMIEDAVKSTSLKSFDQYIMNSESRDLRMYDYRDEMKNMEEYGQPVPPAYNISHIRLKTIALFRGTNDYLSDPQDQMILLSRLRVPLYEDHILEDYSHIDFIASPTVTRDINEPILRILDATTGRRVKKVAHTLGEPHGEIGDSSQVIDVSEDDAISKIKTLRRLQEDPSLQLFPSLPISERPSDKVATNQRKETIREQLGLPNDGSGPISHGS